MGLIEIELSTTSVGSGPEPSLDIVPEHIVPSGPPPARRRVTASVALALLTHLGFAGLAVLLLQWRDLIPPPERAIPVEIVLHAPSPPDAPGNAPAPRSPDAAPPAPADAARAPDEAAPSPAAPSKSASTPPPLLVEPPPDPARATAQPTINQQANLAPDKPASPAAKAAAAPAEAPTVLNSAAGTFAVAPPAAKPPDQQPMSKAVGAPDRDPAAELAAALPMDLSALPPSFRAVLSGGGQLPVDEYKGVVFGRLGRSQGAIAEARSRHLRGTVLVSFSVADDGRVLNLRVGHSSGTPALDALALQMVREAAPFPPPPPNSQRAFTPVLSFGDD